MTFIDGRLRDQMKQAGEAGPVEVVIVVDADHEWLTRESAGRLLAQVIQGVIQRTGDQPESVRYFTGANAAVILANGKFIRAVMDDEHVVVASATDVGVFPFCN